MLLERKTLVSGVFTLENGHFFDTESVVNILRHPQTILERIPVGEKSNVYMTINNDNNLQRRARGTRSQFDDDCGAWTLGRSVISNYWKMPSGEFRYLFSRNGQYCSERIVGGTRTYLPLEPQPADADVYTLHRYYATQSDDGKPVYRKRVTWVSRDDFPPVALVEYVGKCKQEQVHGNRKGDGPVYVRTPSTTMESVAEQVKATSVKAVYDGMITSLDIDDAPRDERVVRNKKYNGKKDERKSTGKTYRANFADEIQTLCSMVTNDDLVKSVTVTSSRVPHVVLCTERQLNEIKAFLFNKQSGSVLSFDKTYNLGSLYVTVGVYRNLALQRVGSGDVPIFIGPIFIHGNSDFETYAHFFSYLSARLASYDCRHLRLGSDEEASVRKAMRHAFSSATLVCCTRHLKDNLRRHASQVS